MVQLCLPLHLILVLPSMLTAHLFVKGKFLFFKRNDCVTHLIFKGESVVGIRRFTNYLKLNGLSQDCSSAGLIGFICASRKNEVVLYSFLSLVV